MVEEQREPDVEPTRWAALFCRDERQPGVSISSDDNIHYDADERRQASAHGSGDKGERNDCGDRP